MADTTTMLSMCDPVHLVLIRTDTSNETTLVSSYFLDWRTVLTSPTGKRCFAVELLGVGEEEWFCCSECKHVSASSTAAVFNSAKDLLKMLFINDGQEGFTLWCTFGLCFPAFFWIVWLVAGKQCWSISAMHQWWMNHMAEKCFQKSFLSCVWVCVARKWM